MATSTGGSYIDDKGTIMQFAAGTNLGSMWTPYTQTQPKLTDSYGGKKPELSGVQASDVKMPQAEPLVSPTTLTPQQVAELNVAAERNNTTDQKNLAYAKATYGFTPTPKATNMGVDNLGTSQVPVPDQTPSNVTMLGNQVATAGMTANERAIAGYLEDQRRLTEQQKAQEQASTDQALAGLNDAYNTNQEAKLRALYDEQGVAQKRKDLEAINAQIQENKAALEQGMINIEGRPIAMDFITGQQALLQRQASAKINTLIAQSALIQDNLNWATNIAEKYFSAAQADRQAQIDRYKTLFEIHNDKLIKLTSEEKDFVNAQIKLLQDQDAQQQSDKDKILKLMVDNPEAWKKANVSFDMPYEEIVKRVAPQLATVATRQTESKLVAELINKYPDANISLSDTLASAQAKLQNSKIYKQATRLSGGGGGDGGVTSTDPAIDFYVSDFLKAQQNGVSFSEWASTIGLDTKTKNAIAKKLSGTPTTTVPPTTPQLDLNGNEILGKDLDTGQDITTQNVGEILAEKERLLAEAKRMNAQNGSIMFKTRITELQNDIVDLQRAMRGETLTQG